MFRLNFSHGTHEEHSAVLADIRRSAARWIATSRCCRICADRRCGWSRSPATSWTAIWTTSSRSSPDRPANARELTCSYRELPNDLKPGETVLFADGTVAMTVVETAPGRARLRVTLPGRVRSRQGLNLPGTDLAVSSLTDKDLHDLDWTAQHADDVDFVGAVVRAQRGGRRPAAARAPVEEVHGRHRGQDREAAGGAASRGDRRRDRRRDGGARRPGRRDGRAARAGDPEAHHRRCATRRTGR